MSKPVKWKVVGALSGICLGAGAVGCITSTPDEVVVSNTSSPIALAGYSPTTVIPPGATSYIWAWSGTSWVFRGGVQYTTSTTHHGAYDWVSFDAGSLTLPFAFWKREGNRYHAQILVRRPKAGTNTAPSTLIETYAMTDAEKSCADNYISGGGAYQNLPLVCGVDEVLDVYASAP